MKIYLSGQISGLPIDEAHANFNNASYRVSRMYLFNHIINPLHIQPLFGVRSWLFHMIADIWQQRKCDATAFQANWTESRGSVVEYFYAKFIFKHRIIML